jgi:hypothetical protein
MYARLIGTGSYLPGNPVSNNDLAARGIDTSTNGSSRAPAFAVATLLNLVRRRVNLAWLLHSVLWKWLVLRLKTSI